MTEAPGQHASTDEAHDAVPSLADARVLREIVELLDDGVYLASPGGRLIDANRVLLQILGLDSVEELRRRGDGIWADAGARARLQEEAAEAGVVRDARIAGRHTDGSEVWLLDTCRACRDEAGELVGFCGVVRRWQPDRADRRPARVALRDPVTGSYARDYLQHQRQFLERPSHFWGCVILRLVGLGDVNERYGRDEGDRVLQRFSHFVIRQKRADDILVRTGGEEFTLLVEVVEPANLESIARRFLDVAPKQAPITFEIGYAYRRPAETVDGVLARAAENLVSGRGRPAVEAMAERRSDADGPGSRA